MVECGKEVCRYWVEEETVDGQRDLRAVEVEVEVRVEVSDAREVKARAGANVRARKIARFAVVVEVDSGVWALPRMTM